MNQNFLIKAYELQNKEKYEDSVNCLEKIYKNFHLLGVMADQIPYTPTIIRENREILSQAHLDKLQERFPIRINTNYDNDRNTIRSNGKKKQNKTKWTPDEQKLFIEGLELYGNKNLKKVSEHVKTRSINQVRSHLQKHQIKQSKVSKIQLEDNEINISQI